MLKLIAMNQISKAYFYKAKGQGSVSTINKVSGFCPHEWPNPLCDWCITVLEIMLNVYLFNDSYLENPPAVYLLPGVNTIS